MYLNSNHLVHLEGDLGQRCRHLRRRALIDVIHIDALSDFPCALAYRTTETSRENILNSTQ